LDHSGYILLRMPDAQKPIFLELLRGFEEFAKLKGYRLSFAFDGSLQDQIAFRFTILEGGIAVSTERVRRDLQDYVTRVQSGSSFEDLDVIIPAEEHHTTLMILKNRLSFLQSSYTAQRNVLRLYENIIKDFGKIQPSASPAFYIQAGGTMNPANYSAINSQQIAQGQGIRMIGNTSQMEIYIGNTFAERKEIVEKIERVNNALLTNLEEDREQKWEARRLLERARDEIADEPQPDCSRVKRYLEKAKQVFSTVTFAKEAVDAFTELLKQVGLS
jgi:hypothetical protein